MSPSTASRAIDAPLSPEQEDLLATLLDELGATEGTAERRALWLDALRDPGTFPAG